MASFFGLGGPAAKVEIALDSDGGGRKTIEVESGGDESAKQELLIYSGGDKVSGTVKVIVPSGQKLEHLGIKVEVVGTVGTLASSTLDFKTRRHGVAALSSTPTLFFPFNNRTRGVCRGSAGVQNRPQTQRTTARFRVVFCLTKSPF